MVGNEVCIMFGSTEEYGILLNNLQIMAVSVCARNMYRSCKSFDTDNLSLDSESISFFNYIAVVSSLILSSSFRAPSSLDVELVETTATGDNRSL
jgi:hypothetical protein